ncbi:MAG: nucleotidyltransferase domain-containing protein [Bacteroidia bacterium]|nr:nucleotidyltransferase domain-containing protein [Bacteroidia bacterium]
MLAPVITNNINRIKAICKEHKVKELYVFGSAARNEMNDKSDVDFIIKFNNDVPVEDYVDLYFDFAESMEMILNTKVDVLLDKPIRNRILQRELDETKQIVYVAA